MGKKSRAKAANAAGSDAKPTLSVKSGKNNLWLILAGAGIMAVLVWATLRTTNSESPSPSTNNTAAAPVKLIATLDPLLYTGKARAAYQVAKDIPEILAQLPCFCGCKDGLGHKNNLYCFADTHGNICDLCQSIALDAGEMHKQGTPVEKIRDTIRTKYGSVKM